MAPPSKDATTGRPSAGANANRFGLHSVGIGDLLCCAIRLCRRRIFVTAQVVPQKAACGRARDRKANFSSANSPTDRLSEGVPGHHRGVPGQLPIFQFVATRSAVTPGRLLPAAMLRRVTAVMRQGGVMKGLFLDAVDDLAAAFRRVARPDDTPMDV